MKNVLVLIHDDDGQEARLQTALDLTRALDGHLTCVDVADLVIMGDRTVGGALVVLDTRAEEAVNRTRIERRLGVEQLPWSWIDKAGRDPSDCLLSAARCADLIVVGGMEDTAAYSLRRLVTRLLGRTHALIVAAAQNANGLDVGGLAVVAWDGSDLAAYALQRAIPLLALAQSVCVLEVGFAETDFSGEEAATYLSRHDIQAEVLRVQPSVDFAATIKLKAKEMNAAYCLMGAYKHRPLSEAVFGGVTRSLLSQCDITLILGH